jgi:hypothetical protein
MPTAPRPLFHPRVRGLEVTSVTDALSIGRALNYVGLNRLSLAHWKVERNFRFRCNAEVGNAGALTGGLGFIVAIIFLRGICR